ncbi:MAG: ABC transporter permease [Verrucomicrobia bacterium]|nr:ABC transporter permease [Verrucomicrobiota bacterium]
MPAMSGIGAVFQDFSRYAHIIRFQAYASLKNEIARTYIGVFWWLLEPTLYALVMYLVVGVIFVSKTPQYLPFLLIGTFSFQWFANSVSSAANSIVSRASLMQQIYLPKVVFPIITVLGGTWKFLFAFGFLAVWVSVFYTPPSLAYCALPLVLAVNLMFNLAIAIPLSAWIPYFRDGLAVIAALMQFLGFASGLFYQTKDVPASAQVYFHNNPIAQLLNAYRDILLYAQWPDFERLAFVAAISLVGLAGGIWLLKHLDLELPKVAL